VTVVGATGGRVMKSRESRGYELKVHIYIGDFDCYTLSLQTLLASLTNRSLYTQSAIKLSLTNVYSN